MNSAPRAVPRQRRAVTTRRRLYEAAMAEYARVGLEAARVEDIVAAAGVSWGTFFHYFPAKEDVLLDAAAEVCRAYAAQTVAGLEARLDTETVLGDAFSAMARAAAEVTPARRMARSAPRRISGASAATRWLPKVATYAAASTRLVLPCPFAPVNVEAPGASSRSAAA